MGSAEVLRATSVLTFSAVGELLSSERGLGGAPLDVLSGRMS